ncbi:MAG: hypothetical protein ACI9P9_000380 [Patescibacteria group bacterium]
MVSDINGDTVTTMVPTIGYWISISDSSYDDYYTRSTAAYNF